MIQTLLNLLFPVDCVLCGHPAVQWRCGALCPDCESAFRPPASPICSKCGDPLPQADALCASCLSGRMNVDLVRAALVFDDSLRRVIHQFKYNDRVSLARPLGRRLAECLRQAPFTADYVVPVPLHRSRERQRGYNQAALLARRLGLEVREDLIRRSRPTISQTGLTRHQRIENVRGAFQCRQAVQGACLIVDDVMTTGATTGEVARTLRNHGASRVEVLTLTRIRNEGVR